MSGAQFLTQLAAQLERAAAEAPRLGAAVVANGRRELELGARLSLPGPGLSEILARSPNARAQVADPRRELGTVEAHMAGELVDGGLRLALGGGL